MAMATETMAATALSAVNLVVLVSLAGVWVRNYFEFRTPLVLGLVAFSAVLAVENAVAVYFFFSMHMLYSGDPVVQTIVLVMRLLQFVAVAALAWVTMR
ncbi:hypothetical protein [Halobacterium bonnevillei]|uniref:Uncharacterized protein n=1 Tax=Halobacterium bonnevillei TaxID=2692200 RepID=A0A6B0SQV5_9EURY|nr:hypothetical protein [Halobacterium bonnevillei]MXR21240.1 hypothetical protein [Halobacterium bonnevillei]